MLSGAAGIVTAILTALVGSVLSGTRDLDPKNFGAGVQGALRIGAAMTA